MSSIDTRQKLIYGDGALQKASLTYKNAQTGREVTLPVQFNPTEYSISRGLRFKNNAGHGEESHPENTQAADSELANLRVSLILDTSTYMPEYQVPKGLSKYLNDENERGKSRAEPSDIFLGQHGILWTHYFLKHQLSDV